MKRQQFFLKITLPTRHAAHVLDAVDRGVKLNLNDLLERGL
jgi:hypothetical protein